MPLRAITENDQLDYIAPLLSDEEWLTLKSEVKSGKLKLILPCCGTSAILRTSKLGTRHFVHKRKNAECEWQGETWQHLISKVEILLACREAGYSVKTEYTGNEWRADVFATKGNVRLAFEIQWSNQTLEKTLERQKRYKDDDIRGCWFFKKLPLVDGYFPHISGDVPMFGLSVTDDGTTQVQFRSHRYDENVRTEPLRDFIRLLLSRKIKFCSHLKAKKKQMVDITFFSGVCWQCKQPTDFYYVGTLLSDCGKEINVEFCWNRDKLEYRPEIRGAVKQFLEGEGRELLLRGVTPRFSYSRQDTYPAFSCFHCNSLQGDKYVEEQIESVKYLETKPKAVHWVEITLESPVTVEYPHWCYPENGELCCK